MHPGGAPGTAAAPGTGKTLAYIGLVLSILAALALVVANGLFVAAEFAIVRVRRTRLEELAGQGKEAAKHAILVVDGVSDYLTTTQIGITVASLGVGWLGESVFARLLADLAPGRVASSFTILHGVAATCAFVCVTMLHVIIGEIVPKNLAIGRADHYLLLLARPLRAFHTAVRPASWLFTAIAGWIQRRLGHKHSVSPPLSEEELKLVLTDSHEGGVLTAGEAKIVMRAFEFADKCAEEIMVPRERVDFLSLARPFEENLAVAQNSRHARLPLCVTGLDSLCGFVSMKDFWGVRAQASNAIFEHACRPPTKISYDLSQEEILRRFQAEGVQIGVVRDVADRHTLGIVTLEDVLESLLGNVRESRYPPSHCG
jgi:CBS domain containing-hemolysin-like protein